MRGLLSGFAFVLLCNAINLAQADLLLAQSHWSSPEPGGGEWGPGSAQPWNGTAGSGPRPGWENPLPFGLSQPPPYDPGLSDQGRYPLPYDDGLLGGSPFERAVDPMRRDDLPSQAPPGWFEQFPIGTYRPQEPTIRDQDYGGYGGYRFRPGSALGEGARLRSSRPSFDPDGFAEPPASAYPTYRFRGDPQASGGGWQAGPPLDPAYQFRPLNNQELGRMGRDGGWRPIEREQAAPPPPPLPRGLSVPGESFGFEPLPRRVP